MSNSHKQKGAAELPAISTAKGGTFHIAHKSSFHSFCSALLKYTWGILVFACIYAGSSIQAYLSFGQLAPIEWLGCAVALMYFLSCVAIFLCLTNADFVLRQSGLTLPFVYFWNAQGRIFWSWSRLNKVTFSRAYERMPTANQVVLSFLTSGTNTVDVHIKVNEIHQLDLKKLVYAIVSNAPHAVIDPPLDKVALEFPTVSGIKHLNFQSFTSLWDDEFSTRFSPTLFVPLGPEDELRGGTIRIVELVACGGSAAIYSAKNAAGKQIIVKEAVIPKNANEQLKAKAIEMFNREALLLSKLDHPHIAKVLDHFVENEHHYELIEYIDGLDLRRFVKERGPQPEDFVLNWAEQICELIVYLHSQDPPIIHRDLTPDNLVLRVDGQLVLIDFGAANAFVGTATGTMVGKQSYMPPEQLRGKSVPQSDIYSLGGTLYFLLTGRDPTPLEVSQVDGDTKVSSHVNQLLARCTAFDVADRYSTAVGLLHSIRTIRNLQSNDPAAGLTLEG